MRAAVRLAGQLQGQIKENPGARQWVVAHSHGGNIALHAVRYLRNSCADAPRVPTVTLATPFIHARRRTLSGWSIFVLASFGFIVTAWAWVTLADGPHWDDSIVLALGALVASDALLCVVGACMHPGFRPGYRSQLIASVHSPTVEPEDLFVIRAAGDEASISLAAGQFLGWTSARLNPLLTNWYVWAVLMLTGTGSAAAALVTHSASSGFRVVIIAAFIVAALVGFLAVGGVSVMLLSAGLPFGLDGPFLSIFASCSAEAAPPGQATIMQLEPFAEAGNRGLAHFGLYRSEPVISKIVMLICGSPPARAPMEPPGSLEDRTRSAGQPGAP